MSQLMFHCTKPSTMYTTMSSMVFFRPKRVQSVSNYSLLKTIDRLWYNVTCSFPIKVSEYMCKCNSHFYCYNIGVVVALLL